MATPATTAIIKAMQADREIATVRTGGRFFKTIPCVVKPFVRTESSGFMGPGRLFAADGTPLTPWWISEKAGLPGDAACRP